MESIRNRTSSHRLSAAMVMSAISCAMAAPSLMIDGKLVIAGRTAKTSEIVRLLKK